MQRRRHVDTTRVVVCRLEGDVFGPEIRADTFEEEAQRDAGPTADIAPALDADVLDDDRGLRQRLKIRQRPGPFVGDQVSVNAALVCSTGWNLAISSAALALRNSSAAGSNVKPVGRKCRD